MPSSATITSFYNFSANTKARASQVNNNFDVFRGHLLPVHVSTATSADNTYYIGSNDYSWSGAFINEITYKGTDIVVKKGSVEKFRIKDTIGVTSSAGVGQIASSSNFSVTGANTGSASYINISGSTLTIQTIGRPVSVYLANLEESYGNFGTVASEGAYCSFELAFFVNNSFYSGSAYYSTGYTGASYFPAPYFNYPNNPLPAGSNIIHLAYRSGVRVNVNQYFFSSGLYLRAYEL